MQKILIGSIATYVPVTKPIPIEKSFKEVEKETKEKLQDNVGTVFINSKTIDKDMVEKSGTQLEKLLKRYKMKINSISFGSQAINTLLGQNVLTVKNQVYAFDYPLFNNPYTKQDILLKSNDSDKYKELVLKGWLTKVDEQNIMIATATHEFAHSLWNNTYQNWKIQHNKRYGIEEDEEIKMGKQLKSLFQKYKKEVQLDPLQLISRYSLTNVNEFLAEGFTQATLSSNPSPYALEIKKIIDEYLGVNNDN